MSEKQVKDSPDQKRIFNIGMHYVQLIQRERIAGNVKMQRYYTSEFLKLCKQANENQSKAAQIIEDDTVKSLNTVNSFRINLASELNKAKEEKNNSSIELINGQMEKVYNTCQVLTFCLQKHAPPPPIEKKQLTIKNAVKDSSIPDNVLRLAISGLDVTEKKSRNLEYFLKIEAPFYDQFNSDIFKLDKVDLNFDLKIIRRDNPKNLERIIKRSLKLTLCCLSKGLLKKGKETDVAHLEIPMKIFTETKHIASNYIMQNLPDAPKNEQFTLKIKMSLSTPLKWAEFTEQQIDYYTIKQGSKLETPWEIPKREFASLPKEEILKMKPELIQMPRIEDLKFMPAKWCKHMMDLMQHNIDVFDKYSVITPPKVIEKRDAYKDQYLALIKTMTNGALTPDKYVQMIKSTISQQIAFVKALKPDQAHLKSEYMERIKAFKAEADEVKANMNK